MQIGFRVSLAFALCTAFLAPSALCQPNLFGGNLTSGVTVPFTLSPVSGPTAIGNWLIAVPQGSTELRVELAHDTANLSLSLYISVDRVYVTTFSGGYYGVTTRFGSSATATAGKPAVIVVNTGSNPPLRMESYYVAIVVPSLPAPVDVKVTATVSSGAASVTSVSAATLARGSSVAPGSIASAFGQGLADRTEVAAGAPVAAPLAGTAVTVKDSSGAERPAPLFFVSPGQVNYLVPEGTATGTATVTVTKQGQAAGSGTVSVETVAPGLFSANADGKGVAAAYVTRTRADGTQANELVFRYDADQKKQVHAPIDLGPPTDRLALVLYGTGIRLRSSPAAVKVKIGGQDCEVLYSGPQGDFVGLDQVNVTLPRTLRGEVEVALTADGKAANVVTISVAGGS